MTTSNVAHDGDDYRIEIADGHFVISRQAERGTWAVEARMSVRAAKVLTSFCPDAVQEAERGRFQLTTSDACDLDEQWVSATPHRAIEAITHAAEAVRTANHATLHRDDFDHQHLYRLMGELSQLAHRLPQFIGQAGEILFRLYAADRIDVDHGDLAGAIAVWNASTTVAVGAAEQLAEHIDRAFSELSAVRSKIVTVEVAAEAGSDDL